MKKAALTALFALALMPAFNAQTPTPRTGQVTLDDLRETSRPLLIFAPKPDDPQLEIQLRTLAEHAPEIAERDITVLALPYNNPSPTAATLSSTEAEAARRRYHVSPADFTVFSWVRTVERSSAPRNPSASTSSRTRSMPCPCARKKSATHRKQSHKAKSLPKGAIRNNASPAS